MDGILIKIFATALALSQVATRPDDVKLQFDPARDQAEVVQLLQTGCTHIRKAFDVEDVPLDDLITTAMNDPEAAGGEIKAFHGLKFSDLLSAYREFCQNQKVEHSAVDIGEVISFYDRTVTNLPDPSQLKDIKQFGLSVVLDGKGGRFAELAKSERRRIWVSLDEIPDHVKQAFVAAEDKRFFQHKGIDERGMIRAFVGNLAQPGRPQGGSTITQQVAKNLLVGDDVSYDRKIREIIVASRLEHMFTKPEILELYLNSIYLGRNSWGVEMAARRYFGKSASALTLAEGGLLAAMTKGPNYFSADRHPERARERLGYVLDRMHEDGAINADQMKQALAQTIALSDRDRAPRDTGLYFADHIAREAKAVAGIDTLAGSSYTVHSTIQPDLQRAAETALQEGLARYERDAGRVHFKGPEANLLEAILHIEAERAEGRSPARGAAAPSGQVAPAPSWQQALLSARLPVHDVHWPTAVVIAGAGGRGDGGLRVGLADGRVMPLSVNDSRIRRSLKLDDVVFVHVVEGRKKSGGRAELRVRPEVQGATLVLDNKTGKILAMAGGFSYSLSQYNRTTQARRQPGSTLKPVTYLAALKAGLQPNTLVLDEPITLAPIGMNGPNLDKDYYWTPRSGSASGAITLRRALENSRNLATAHLLDGGIAKAPEESLDKVCAIATEAQLYAQCLHYYPFVLGAQPLRIIDLAAFYAAIASEGMRPSPHAIESIERNGKVVYRNTAAPVEIGGGDPASFYQLKTMLQGVVARGTARSIGQLSPYVAGKTGTTDDANDGWFVGFTNDVTVATWVGYDNADEQHRTLGDGETGAKVALPIFQPIIAAVWAGYAPRSVLAPPSPRAQRQLADLPIDLYSGVREDRGGGGGFIEHFHRNSRGEVEDTRVRLVADEEPRPSRKRVRSARAREEAAAAQMQPQPFDTPFWGFGGGDTWGNSARYRGWQ